MDLKLIGGQYLILIENRFIQLQDYKYSYHDNKKKIFLSIIKYETFIELNIELLVLHLITKSNHENFIKAYDRS